MKALGVFLFILSIAWFASPSYAQMNVVVLKNCSERNSPYVSKPFGVVCSDSAYVPVGDVEPSPTSSRTPHWGAAYYQELLFYGNRIHPFTDPHYPYDHN